MPDSGQRTNANLRAALEAYAAFLRQRRKPNAVTFDALCAEHQALTKDLRQLNDMVMLAQSLADAAWFQRTVREAFGEEAEVRLALDENDPTARDNQATLADSAADQASALPGHERYTLQNEVARGGMGIIYKVRDRELNRTLAMKVMLGAPPACSLSHPMGEGRGEGSPTSHPLLARFLEEVQVTAQLDHPGIVAVHELGLDAAGRPYFTMKLVKGRDLSRILQLARAEQEGWNLPRAVAALIKACQAVAFAHSKGVIHRDLKPANIMVGRFGEVYVMDWGLAKVTGRQDLHDLRLAPAAPTTVTEIQTPRGASGSTTADSPLITMDGSVVSTPAYMPPEQARGQVEQVDAQSDMYSLGAILYNLLTGQAPYVEPGTRISPHTILARVLDGPPKRIHTLNPEAPPELIAICEKAMAREKHNRYASSLDLAEDLQAWLDHRVVKAYRTGAVAEFKLWVARNQAAALAGAAALVFLLVGLAGTVNQWKAAQQALYDSRVREYNSLVGEANAWRIARRVGYRDKVFKLLQQARMIEVPQKDLSELRREAVACLGDFVGLTPRTFTDFPANTTVTLTRLDPTGQAAAFGLSDGTILVRRLPSGEIVGRLNADEELRRFCFSARGDRLISVHFPSVANLQERLAGARVHVRARGADGQWREAEGSALPGAFECFSSLAGELIATHDPASQSVVLVHFSDSRVLGSFAYEMRAADNPTVALSSDGRLLAIVAAGIAEDASISLDLWDVSNGRQIGRVATGLASVFSLSFSPDGRNLACLSMDGTAVKIYMTDQLHSVGTIREYFEWPAQVAFMPGNTVKGRSKSIVAKQIPKKRNFLSKLNFIDMSLRPQNRKFLRSNWW